MEMTDELLLLESVYRAIHGISKLDLNGQDLRVRFLPITQGEKVSLWQSINSPIQSAVYFSLEPVPVLSTRIQRIPPVRAVEIHTSRKERGTGNQ